MSYSAWGEKGECCFCCRIKNSAEGKLDIFYLQQQPAHKWLSVLVVGYVGDRGWFILGVFEIRGGIFIFRREIGCCKA